MKGKKVSYLRIRTAWGGALLAFCSKRITDFILPSLTPRVPGEWVKSAGKEKWAGRLEKKVKAYFKGAPVDFSLLSNIDFSFYTPFQKRILKKLRQVGYGKTVSYKELARMAGSKRACRAAGSVMAKNRTPLLIPCHRVIKSDGHPGGFSGPRGMKRRLLSLEKLIGKRK